MINIRRKIVHILVALRQTDFPTVLASVSVLDSNYLYLYAAVPSARRIKKKNTKLNPKTLLGNLSQKRLQTLNLCVVKYGDSLNKSNQS